MILQKTIKAKIVNLTDIKQQKIQKEYTNFQNKVKLYQDGLDFLDIYKTIPLYSATSQQAERLVKRAKPKHNQPLIIRRDCIKIQQQDTKVSDYWARIPIHKKSIWVAIQFPKQHKHLLEHSIRECKILSKNNNWFLLITIQTETEIHTHYNSLIAIDLGEKNIATSVELKTNRVEFYGKKVRGVRRHYAWLRKRLGNKKALKTIKKIGQKEQRIVNYHLHKISRDIVNRAKETNSAIVLGNLKGIRKSAKNKGRRFNRIVSNMPYYKLTQYIEYKANDAGLQVVKISERNTSKTCSKCGSIGSRQKQSVFNCSHCGLKDYNADLNGATNILKRFSGQCLENGGLLAIPELTQ